MDMSKVKDRRMVAALGFLSRADVGYVGMVNGLSDTCKDEIAKIYPKATDAEAFVVLAVKFAYDQRGSFEVFIEQELEVRSGERV